MSEQDLDQTNVGLLLEQVGGKTVPQRVRRHPLLDVSHVGSGMNGASELPRCQRQHRITSGEFCPAALLRGFLPLLGASPAMLCLSASIRFTTLSARGRGFAAIIP